MYGSLSVLFQYGLRYSKTMFSHWIDVFFWLTNGPFFSGWTCCLDVTHRAGWA